MLDEGIADSGAGAGDEVERFFGNAGFVCNFDEFGGDGHSVAGGLEHHGVPGCERGHRHAGHDGGRKVPWWNYDAYAERDVYEIIFLTFHGRHFLRTGEAK